MLNKFAIKSRIADNISCAQITQATTEGSVQSLAKEYSEMVLESGFTKAASAITLADRENLIKSLCLHHTIFKCKAELDQLKEGLHTLGVAVAIKVLPDVFVYLCIPLLKRPLLQVNS